MRGSRQDHLEELAEELIKKNPEESVVKAHMKAAGLRYTEDAIERLNLVLSSLDGNGGGKTSQRNGKDHGKDL